MLVYVASGLSTLAIARILGPRAYGLYAAGVAVASVALVLNYFGQDQLFLKGGLDSSTLRLRNAQVGVISTCLLGVVVLSWPSISETTQVCALLFGGAIIAQRLLLPFLTQPLFNLNFHQRARREILATGIWPVLGFGLGYAFGHTPVDFASGYFAAAGVLLLGRIHPRDFARVFTDLPFRDFWKGLPFAISGAFYVIYFQSDVAVLGSMTSAHVVGLYAAATSLLGVSLLMSTLLTNDVMRTRLYKLEPGTSAFQQTARSTGVMVTLLGLGIGGVVAGGAHLLLVLVFGSAFGSATVYLQIFGLAIAIYYVSNWCSNILIAAGSINRVVATQCFLAVVNVVGNILLIPHFGAAGSAWMTVGCEALGAVIFAVVLFLRGYLTVSSHGRRS